MKNILILLTVISLAFLSDESFAKIRKKTVKLNETTISSDYLIEFNLSQKECEKMIEDPECFRRDQMRDKPYYHHTQIKIFKDKIFAIQSYKNSEERKADLLLPIKSGHYNIFNGNDNLMSFSVVEGGVVQDLKLLKGDLKKEQKLQSSCEMADFIYSFNVAYKKEGMVQEKGFYRNEFRFDGLKQFFIMVDDSTPNDVDVLVKSPNQNPKAIKDLHLCKLRDEVNFLVKFDLSQCGKNPNSNLAACEKYKYCYDYLIVKDCRVELLQDLPN